MDRNMPGLHIGINKIANQTITMVYNNLVFSGKELKNNWKIPAKESWHSRYFKEKYQD
jgi:hypothetical protein